MNIKTEDSIDFSMYECVILRKKLNNYAILYSRTIIITIVICNENCFSWYLCDN